MAHKRIRPLQHSILHHHMRSTPSQRIRIQLLLFQRASPLHSLHLFSTPDSPVSASTPNKIQTHLSQTVPGPIGPGPHFSTHFPSLYRPGNPHCRHIRCPSAFVGGNAATGGACTGGVSIEPAYHLAIVSKTNHKYLLAGVTPALYFGFFVGAPVTTGVKKYGCEGPPGGRDPE